MGEEDVAALQNAIRILHGCEPTFVEVVHVHETFEGATVWDGDVHVFDIAGHPLASRAFAWSYSTTGTKRRYLTVLAVPPVDSPLMAVRAVIVNDVRAAAN